MTEQEEPEAGWYLTIQEAAENAEEMEEDVEAGQIREIVFQGKKNPIHEFRAKLKNPRD